MTASRRIGFVGFVVAAVGLIIGATAFACSGSGVLTPTSTPQPAQGLAGTQVTMAGEGFASRPVEIQWDNGAVLGQAAGPEFSVVVTIPVDARPGVHTVLAVQEGVSPGRMSFEVLRAARASEPTPGGGGPSQPAGVVTATASGAAVNPPPVAAPSGPVVVTPVPPSPVTPTPVAGPVSAPTVGTPADQPATVAAGVTETPPVAALADQSVAEPAPTTPLPASSNPAAVTTDSGEVVFGGSLSAPAADPARSSPSTAGADVWSGLKSGPRSSLSGDLTAPSAGRSTSTMTIGIGLLGVGLVIMVVGFGVAEMTRRRALAVSESDR